MRVVFYFILISGIVSSCTTKEVADDTTNTEDGAKKTFLDQDTITYKEVDESAPITEETAAEEDPKAERNNKDESEGEEAKAYVFVKEVWGNVEFVVGEKRIVVKGLSSFSEKSGVFILKDKDSELFIRIGDKRDVLDFSEEKYKYPLKELIAPKQDLGKKEEGFLDKFFNIFSFSHDDAKINGMMIAPKSGISRSFNDTNIIFIETINIIDGHPLKIDFSSSIDSDKIGNNKFNVLVKSKYSDRIIFDQIITETYFTINDTANNSFSINWDIEINNINSLKKIKGTVASLWIKSEKRKLLNQLKDKAIAESKTDESVYQIVFIESLRSSGLLANACYYLDLFIETNNNPKLIDYKLNN